MIFLALIEVGRETDRRELILEEFSFFFKFIIGLVEINGQKRKKKIILNIDVLTFVREYNQPFEIVIQVE